MRGVRIGWGVLLLLAGSTLVAQPVAAVSAEVLTIRVFVEQKKQWLKQVGRRQTIEGRYSVTGNTLLKFHGCDLEFRSTGTLPKLTRRTPRDNNVQITGRLQRRAGKLFFQVERVTKLPDDLAVYRQSRPKGPTAKPEDWYALARWATRRGAFYKDRELEAKATEANGLGIGLARRQAVGDPAALVKVAATAVTLKVDPGLVRAIRHEAVLVERKLAGRDVRKREALREKVGRELAGARDPDNQATQVLVKRYRDDPVAVYEAADAADQKRLHRVLFADLSLELIVATARPDGSNGYEIARRILEQVPEAAAEAEGWVDKALTRDLARVLAMNRNELDVLLGRLKERKQDDRARQATDAWLAVRRDRLLREGVAGRLRLSDLYLSLKNDRGQAVLLLEEADRIQPGSRDVAEAMAQLGYFKKEGKWVAGTRPDQPPARPAAVGGVRIGMTHKQVLKAMGGPPRRVTRVAAAYAISEIWVYGEPMGSRIAVHLLRTRGKVLSIVKGISQLKARR